MSASQFLAQLNVPGYEAFCFVLAPTSFGFIPDKPRRIQEPLTDPGVDYMRWRDVQTIYDPFVLDTTEEASSYTSGESKLRSYMAAVTKFADLSYTAGGVSRTFRKVKVESIANHPRSPQSILFAGKLDGYGSSSGSTAVLMARWTLRLTQAGG